MALKDTIQSLHTSANYIRNINTEVFKETGKNVGDTPIIKVADIRDLILSFDQTLPFLGGLVIPNSPEEYIINKSVLGINSFDIGIKNTYGNDNCLTAVSNMYLPTYIEDYGITNSSTSFVYTAIASYRNKMFFISQIPYQTLYRLLPCAQRYLFITPDNIPYSSIWNISSGSIRQNDVFALPSKFSTYVPTTTVGQFTSAVTSLGYSESKKTYGYISGNKLYLSKSPYVTPALSHTDVTSEFFQNMFRRNNLLNPIYIYVGVDNYTYMSKDGINYFRGERSLYTNLATLANGIPGYGQIFNGLELALDDTVQDSPVICLLDSAYYANKKIPLVIVSINNFANFSPEYAYAEYTETASGFSQYNLDYFDNTTFNNKNTIRKNGYFLCNNLVSDDYIRWEKTVNNRPATIETSPTNIYTDGDPLRLYTGVNANEESIPIGKMYRHSITGRTAYGTGTYGTNPFNDLSMLITGELLDSDNIPQFIYNDVEYVFHNNPSCLYSDDTIIIAILQEKNVDSHIITRQYLPIAICTDPTLQTWTFREIRIDINVIKMLPIAIGRVGELFAVECYYTSTNYVSSTFLRTVGFTEYDFLRSYSNSIIPSDYYVNPTFGLSYELSGLFGPDVFPDGDIVYCKVCKPSVIFTNATYYGSTYRGMVAWKLIDSYNISETIDEYSIGIYDNISNFDQSEDRDMCTGFAYGNGIFAIAFSDGSIFTTDAPGYENFPPQPIKIVDYMMDYFIENPLVLDTDSYTTMLYADGTFCYIVAASGEYRIFHNSGDIAWRYTQPKRIGLNGEVEEYKPIDNVFSENGNFFVVSQGIYALSSDFRHMILISSPRNDRFTIRNLLGNRYLLSNRNGRMAARKLSQAQQAKYIKTGTCYFDYETPGRSYFYDFIVQVDFTPKSALIVQMNEIHSEYYSQGSNTVMMQSMDFRHDASSYVGTLKRFNQSTSSYKAEIVGNTVSFSMENIDRPSHYVYYIFG